MQPMTFITNDPVPDGYFYLARMAEAGHQPATMIEDSESGRVFVQAGQLEPVIYQRPIGKDGE